MTIPQQMTTIAITSPGAPEVLKPERITVPVPRDKEMLIKVAAAGVNRPDILQRQGSYAPPPGAPATPGLEVAGRVVKSGASVSRYKEGDAVCALVPGGGYAEYCVAAEDNALPVPQGISMTEAGAIPETFFTVWTNVCD
jgi:NADPH2:quinone reductase